MEYVADGYEPTEFFRYFEEISAIPRSSGNEKEISDYLNAFAEKNGLEHYTDGYYNTVIKKPASEGSENTAPIILQGHTDMVCEKNSDAVHDFAKDGLKLRVKNGFITADGTTLGADNGAAVALMLTILADKTLIHPPVECVFTTQEETGLFGAQHIDASLLRGKTMINLDSEEEGIATISCAGGMRVRFYKDAQWSAAEGTGIGVKISGLSGGHSGTDIGLDRANANKLMARIAEHIAEERYFYRIAKISGGSKDNAIPRECECVFALNSENDYAAVEQIILSEAAELKDEYAKTDPQLKITTAPTPLTRAMSEKATESLIGLLYLSPNGVLKRSAEAGGFIVASLNMGVVNAVDNGIVVTFSARSSVSSVQQDTRRQLALFASLCGFAMQVDSSYPGWTYNPKSPIREICQKCYRQLTGIPMKVEAIHAGLECGLFVQKIPDLDVIAVGPNIFDCHTPDERLDIDSCSRFYTWLVRVLAELA